MLKSIGSAENSGGVFDMNAYYEVVHCYHAGTVVNYAVSAEAAGAVAEGEIREDEVQVDSARLTVCARVNMHTLTQTTETALHLESNQQGVYVVTPSLLAILSHHNLRPLHVVNAQTTTHFTTALQAACAMGAAHAVVATHTPHLSVLDITSRSTAHLSHHVAIHALSAPATRLRRLPHMHKSLLVESLGTVVVADLNQPSSVRAKSMACHAGGLIDWDIIGTTLATIGLDAHWITEPLVKLFDIRMMRLMDQFHLEPTTTTTTTTLTPEYAHLPLSLRFNPARKHQLSLLRYDGHLAFLDCDRNVTADFIAHHHLFPIPGLLHQHDSVMPVSLRTSSTGHVLGVSDSLGRLSLLQHPYPHHVDSLPADRHHPLFSLNHMSNPIPIASPTIPSHQSTEKLISVDDHDTPLNTIGMPFLEDKMAKLSSANWPAKWVHPTAAYKTPEIPRELLAMLQQRREPVLLPSTGTDSGKKLESHIEVGYARNTLKPKLKRNQAQWMGPVASNGASSQSMDPMSKRTSVFLSEQARRDKRPHSRSRNVSKPRSRSKSPSTATSSKLASPDPHHPGGTSLPSHSHLRSVSSPSASASASLAHATLKNRRHGIQTMLPSDVPHHYSLQHIQYSRFGIEDFDFQYFNYGTGLSGLENGVEQCFLNSVFYALMYSCSLVIHPPAASCLSVGAGMTLSSGGTEHEKSHGARHKVWLVFKEIAAYHAFPFTSAHQHPSSELIIHRCDEESCLLCEMAYLMDMLDMAKGGNCQATNLLKAYRTNDQVRALGLVDNHSGTYIRLVQNCFRFLLDSFHRACAKGDAVPSIKPGSSDSNHPSVSGASGGVSRGSAGVTPIQELFGIPMVTKTVCTECRYTTTRQNTSLCLDLISATPSEPTDVLFHESLKSSLEKSTQTRAWCEKCRAYRMMNQVRRVNQVELPPVLCMLNQSWMTSDASRDRLVARKESGFKFWMEERDHVLESPDTDDGVDGQQQQQQGEDAEEGVDDLDGGLNEESRDGQFGNGGGGVGGDKQEEKRRRLLDRWWRVWKDAGQMEDQIRGKTLLPMSLAIETDQHENLVVRELNDPPSSSASSATTSNTTSAVIYDLNSILCEVKSGPEGSHLVTFVRIPLDYITGRHAANSHEPSHQWYMFNDFLVRPVSALEAVQLRSKWKSPCIVQYARRDNDTCLSVRPFHDLMKQQSKSAMFDAVMLGGLHGHAPHVKPLSYAEYRDVVKSQGRFLVAIDAEFVALSKEETAVRPDGTKCVVKPPDMHLARLSLVRGQVPDHLVPFTDDYIETKEPIVDYLTEYSGIVPADLDTAVSTRRLVCLKAVYRQLRLLVDWGAIFVGHGLKKDFRTINLVISSRQVVDTVDLFKLEGQRNISLRFLAWYVLKMDVQSSMHDSIEDARTALLLYEAYERLEQRGELRVFLEKLYQDGRGCGWRAPHWK